MRLRQELSLRQENHLEFGPFEQRLLDTAEFRGINLDDPRNTYHRDILQGMLMRFEETKTSLIGQILQDQENLSEQDLNAIHIESFGFEDIDLDVGTKRNVDKVTLKCNDHPDLVITASIDKERYRRQEDSPSMKETEILRMVKEPSLVWSVQRWYGSTLISDARGMRGIICKEYLPGVMLENFTLDIEETLLDNEPSVIADLAYQVGRTVANAKSGLGGMPTDSHPMNLIVDETDGGIRVRYCDVEGIVVVQDKAEREIDLLRKKFGDFAKDFDRGLLA